MPTVKTRAEAQSQRAKLATSYNELLEEFSAQDLRTVGNYTLGRLIGKGSFGKVYLATHKLTNGSKVVLKSANKDDSNLAREIHHHRQFNHPHIARLYEVIVTETLVWLVLEYCPGDELYNYLLQNGPLPVDKVQKIFTQLVGAVSYVHNKFCVHRDLKLENILLDKHGNVKLCDFGFTREYEGKASYLQTFCGTVCYSAPEMLKGEKYAGEKVDVWSLGVILYALLTGELPFDEDDDAATKMKILGSEPKYPDHLPEEAKKVIGLLLSKRPLLRPGLSDLLSNPFLAEHASQQQVILKLQQPPPFTTKLEKDTLERMQGAGVDIDRVIENVLSQRCDSLAGWWTLLLEREERKEKRRERKRKEKEAEAKNLRRLSAASSRLERMAPTLKEVDEEGEPVTLTRESSRRGRQGRTTPTPQIVLPELPKLPEVTIPIEENGQPSTPPPPPPIDKDSIRSGSSTRYPPPPPPKEGARRSRTSTLQLVASNPDLLSPNGFVPRRQRRRNQHPIIRNLAQIKQWFMDSAKRARSPSSRHDPSTTNLAQEKTLTAPRSGERKETDVKKPSGVNVSVGAQPRTTHPPPSQNRGTPQKRTSLSPSPMTPHASYRRSSAGLRGRKSTSSSISSVRSIQHRHSHSKASSTSSASITSSANKTPRSPRNSVKVLPATPTASTFPSNIRVVRSPLNNYNEPANFGSSGPPSNHGLVFARRKKHTFKGPTLSLNTTTATTPGGSSGSSPSGANNTTRRDSGVAPGGRRSLSASGQQRRRSGETIKEEDEDEIEEVDAFSPVVGPGEVEEAVIEGDMHRPAQGTS